MPVCPAPSSQSSACWALKCCPKALIAAVTAPPTLIMILSNLTDTGPLGTCLALGPDPKFLLAWSFIFLPPQGWPQEPLPCVYCTQLPWSPVLGEQASPEDLLSPGLVGWAECWAPSGLCSQALPTPSPTMARPVGVCPPPGHSLPQDRAIVRVSSFRWTGPQVLGPSVHPLHASAVLSRSHRTRVTSTTMYEATTAAAALPPVQKKLNLFHILINQCEFLIESRAASWGLGALRRKAACGPGVLSSKAGTEPPSSHELLVWMFPSARHRDTAVSKAGHPPPCPRSPQLSRKSSLEKPSVFVR